MGEIEEFTPWYNENDLKTEIVLDLLNNRLYQRFFYYVPLSNPAPYGI